MPRQPPALPPRPSQQQSMPMAGYGGGMNYNSYGGYGNSGPYNTQYSNMYNGGMYDAYGGFNRFDGPVDASSQSGFVRTAKDSSQQAFQSIETVVQACRSISMMLDSTYYAVYNSFNAVIGVADHFSRLKQHLSKMLSALALIRTLKWLCRRLLVLLRLRQSGRLDEELWTQATAEAGAVTWLSEGGAEGKTSRWPIVLFFAVVFGGPWLVWKLLAAFAHGSGRSNITYNVL